jgi:hypothetical protein
MTQFAANRAGLARHLEAVLQQKSSTGFCRFLYCLISQDLRSFSRPSPLSLHLPFTTTCLTYPTPPAQSRAVRFPIFGRLLPDSAFITD